MMDRNDLTTLLKDSIVMIDFEKKDGTLRSMRCTLQEQFLPTPVYKDIETTKKKENAEVLSVWDLDSNGWRSFRIESVKSVKVG